MMKNHGFQDGAQFLTVDAFDEDLRHQRSKRFAWFVIQGMSISILVELHNFLRMFPQVRLATCSSQNKADWTETGWVQCSSCYLFLVREIGWFK